MPLLVQHFTPMSDAESSALDVIDHDVSKAYIKQGLNKYFAGTPAVRAQGPLRDFAIHYFRKRLSRLSPNSLANLRPRPRPVVAA